MFLFLGARDSRCTQHESPPSIQDGPGRKKGEEKKRGKGSEAGRRQLDTPSPAWQRAAARQAVPQLAQLGSTEEASTGCLPLLGPLLLSRGAPSRP